MSDIRIGKDAAGGIEIKVDGHVVKNVLAVRFEQSGPIVGTLRLELLATSIEIECQAEVELVKVDPR